MASSSKRSSVKVHRFVALVPCSVRKSVAHDPLNEGHDLWYVVCDPWDCVGYPTVELSQVIKELLLKLGCVCPVAPQIDL